MQSTGTTAKERAAQHRQIKLQQLLEHIEKCSVCAGAAWYASSRREQKVEYPSCEEGNRLILLALHASRNPSGIDVVLAGECPLGKQNPMDCLDCSFGHASECHHPMDCQTARCAFADPAPLALHDPAAVAASHIREIRREFRVSSAVSDAATGVKP